MTTDERLEQEERDFWRVAYLMVLLRGGTPAQARKAASQALDDHASAFPLTCPGVDD